MLESEYLVKAPLLDREIIPGKETSFLRFSGVELSNHIDQLSSIVALLAANGFGLPEMMTPERLKPRLLKEGDLIIAVDSKAEGVGFQIQTVFQADEEKYLYYSRVVRKDKQGQGIGGQLLHAAIEAHKPTIIAARSQNPAEIYSFIRVIASLGVNDVFPFTKSFSQDEKALRALYILVEKLGYSKDTNLITGVCEGAYPEGRLGDYVINKQHSEINVVENQLQKLGINRQNGDAIFYLAFLNN